MKDWRSVLSSPMQREIVQGTSVTLGFRVLGICVSYLFTWYASRYIGLAAYGIFSVVFALFQVSGKFSRWGLEKASMKYIAEARSTASNTQGEWYATSLLGVLTSTGLVALVFYGFSEQLSVLFFDNTSYVGLMSALAISLPILGLFELNVWTLKGLKRIPHFAFFSNAALFFFAVMLLLLLSQTSISVGNLPSMAVFGSVAICAILSTIFVWPHVQPLALHHFGARLQKLVRVGFPMLVAGSMFMLLSWTDTLILGAYVDDTTVGSYNIVMKIAKVMGIFFVALNGIYSPKVSEYFVKQNMKGLERMTVWSSKLIALITTPMWLVIVLFPSFLMSLFNSEMISSDSILALRILSIGMFVNALVGNVAPLMQLTGKQRIVQNIAIVTTAINIGLNLVFIPTYGMVGAAISSAIALIAYNVISVIFVWRSFRIHVNFMQQLWK